MHSRRRARRGLLAHPFEALGHIAYSIAHLEGAYLLGREGVAAFWIGLAVGTALVVVALVRQRGKSAARMARAGFWLWCCIVILGAAIISYLALWMQHTPDGVPGVMGVQYRYFMPYLSFAALMVADIVTLLRDGPVKRSAENARPA